MSVTIAQQLAEVDSELELLTCRAITLRNRLSRGHASDVEAVSQLADALDRILQLKLSKDLLLEFAGFEMQDREKGRLH